MSSQCSVDSFYNRCMYKKCKNGKSHGKRLFRFPKQDARCKTWICNTGNTHLEKMSVNTIRKLGLCEDHFLDTSFTNATKERLTRDAVPVAYENASSLTNEENVEVQEMQRHSSVAQFSTNNDMLLEEQMPQSSIANEENVEVEEMQRHSPVAQLSTNDENIILEEQTPQECALRTYRPAAVLNFEISAEEEDVMEWVRLEPPVHQNVKRKDNSTEINIKQK
ncbi:uncharacterized protein [Temnothorax longispinosus]|uniref:uncharacterized protein isoform X2 n=1 Tax=Temnothorax longispinosus TaxID=300112 RepID=UPI003A9A30C1